MQVTLINERKLHSINLPENVVESYWLTEKTDKEEKRIINIKATEGNWQIKSSSYSQIINPKYLKVTSDKIIAYPVEESIIESANLKEDNMYAIREDNSQGVSILYCAGKDETKFEHREIIDTQKITIGSSEENEIVYKNNFVLEMHAEIIKKDGKWIIKNNDIRFGTFVNGTNIKDEEKVLLNGDVIFIMGLRIIIIGNHLYINNPKNSVIIKNRNLVLSRIKNTLITKDDKDVEETFTEEQEYYTRAPRITKLIEEEELKIDEPPKIQDDNQRPTLLIIGSSLSMGIVMMISIISTIQGNSNGTATAFTTTLAIISALLMLVAMIVIPFLDIRYDKKSRQRYENRRQNKYKDYLKRKEMNIKAIKDKQKRILYENYPPTEECAEIVLKNDHRLWERKVEDQDFLSVRLGIGDVPLKVNISYPQEKFEMEDDSLIDSLNNIIESSETIENAPIVTSLVDKNVSAFVSKDNDVVYSFMKYIILQLVAFHSYEDLKLVFFTNEVKTQNWEYVKMLPHIWDDTKQNRFFADNLEDINNISRYLLDELKNRRGTEEQRQNEERSYKNFSPYYLIITDDYKKIENLGFITDLLKEKQNLGFSLLCITDDLFGVPNECKTFINLENNENGMIFDNEISSTNQRKISLEHNIVNFEKITEKLANIPIRAKAKGTTTLPNTYTFLEMYNVGRIERLNILERWKKSDSTLSLKAPIGIDGVGMPIFLDIHEKAHGPHGLIAGSTGSRKIRIYNYICIITCNKLPSR